MATDMKMTGIRLSEEQHNKIRYIAEHNHRKLNDEFRYIIDKHIQMFEYENGEIKLEDK